MKIAIITSGVAPVPATMGGAVENLVEYLIDENEKSNNVEIEIYSIYDLEAKEISQHYKNTTFKYIKTSKVSKYLDNVLYFIITVILKKNNNMKFRNLFKRFEYVYKIRRILYENDYDKVILQNHPTLFLSIKGKNEQKYRGKYYIHFHNEISSVYGCSTVARGCKKIIGVSQFICNSVKPYFPTHPKESFEVLYNCIDVNTFNRLAYKNETQELREKYGIDKNDMVALFSGRLVREKGIIETIQAFKRIAFAYPKLKLLIVGNYFYNSDMTSEELKVIKNMAKDVETQIKFTGYIDYKDIPKIYALSDFAILPSMWEEPAGLTLIEAMASGLPIITTNSGGIPEYVSEECAFILPRDENLVENIANKIEILINNKDLRCKMGEFAIDWAKRYNTKNYYVNFLAILRKEE